ncbi:MAG: hypothetical protein ACFLMY_14980 [Candidatus Brachytrichaceae bacterium NZ_4S206]|jgi:hypothetical protein
MNRGVFSCRKKAWIVLLVGMCLSVSCQTSVPADATRRWIALPEQAAQILAQEPLGFGHPSRYIVHARREAFSSSGTVINPDTVMNIWYTDGRALTIATYEQWRRDHSDDMNNFSGPFKHSYIEFVVRDYALQDTMARVLFTEAYGEPYLAEMVLRWDGTRWQKESIREIPWPPPDRD